MSENPRSNLSKVFENADAAIRGLSDGAALFVGGVHGRQLPESLLNAVIRAKVGDLTVICQDIDGPEGNVLERLVESGRVSTVVSPLPFDPRRNSAVKQLWEAGRLQIEPCPMGILAERIRAGGAGLGGVFLPTGANTRFAVGLETRQIEGQIHALHSGLRADFALLRGHVADSLGNIIYSGVGRNMSPVMAMAARVSVVEVDEIREPGGLDPETVITPAIFVQRIVTSVSAD